MSKVIAGITTSVDGYIAGPDDGPAKGLGEGGERPHYWVFGGPWSSSPVALSVGSGLVGLAWGVILTGIASVVIRSAPADSTSVAVAVNAVTRNTAVAIGAQVAFAIVAGPDVAGAFPAESGYTWAFAMGGLGAGLLLLASTLMPAHTVAARASR